MSFQITANIPHRLINVDEFYCMANAGILTEDERVELIEGQLLKMSPIGSVHANIVDYITDSLFQKIDGNVRVRVQNPLFLSNLNEPEPDIVLVRKANYSQQHPRPSDVFLLIEVADSSENYDRKTKLPLYAHYQIPEVWLINIKQKKLEIYQKPSDEGYRLNFFPEKGKIIAPLLINTIELDWWAWFDGCDNGLL